jgi:flagellar hook-associated protein 2
MASTSSVSGLSSGIDWQSMIEQIRTAEHKPIDLISQQKSVQEKKLKAWQELNTKLLALKTAAEKLNKAQGFNLFTSTSRSSTATNPDDFFTATLGEAGQIGSYAIEVLQTARVEKWSSRGFTSQSIALGESYAGSFLINGRTVTVAADDTLADVRTKINNLNSGDQATKVTASIVSYSATDNRLILTSQTEGAAGITLAPILEPEGAPNLVTAFGLTEIQTGLDASLMVDGVSVMRSSNTISDLLPGITLNLKKAEVGTTVTLNVNQDLEGVTGLIKGFVDQYNQVMDFIRTQSTYNQTNKQAGGILFGDGTLRSVRKDLVNLVINPIGGVTLAFSTLGLVGIKLNNQGNLSVDESTIKGYLRTNFDDIKKLFIAEGTSSSSSLDYVSHRLETKPGTYAVNISQAPASGVDIAGTINGEAAIGNGDTLTGAPGTSAEGLVVSYSGATTGDVGSVTLTTGVAEAFSRILYSLTDSLDGYVADKQTGIQNRIDNLGKKINVMEDRLDKRMEVLTSQYVAMETSMSKMQSLSSWLSSQISQLSK